jgi:hypothetical protein
LILGSLNVCVILDMCVDDGFARLLSENTAVGCDADLVCSTEVMDVDQTVELHGPPLQPSHFRSLEQIPKMADSPAVYLCCGFDDSATLKEYILSICGEHTTAAVLGSVHRDPLPIQGIAQNGYVLQFVSAAQAAQAHAMVMLPGWTYIPEAFAADVVTAASDGWTLGATASSPGTWADLPFNPPAVLPVPPSAPVTDSLASSTSELADLQPTLPELISPSSSPAGLTSAVYETGPSDSGAVRPLVERVSIRPSPYPSTRESKMKARRRRGTVKQNRTGH